MRLSRLYITLTLVILASCEDSFENVETNATVHEPLKLIDDAQESGEIRQSDEDTLKINDDAPRDLSDEKLPILPPIILLDFSNDLDNASTSGDEKSKRTVDSNLGYGFGRNNLFTGKYNYYFPAGKTGTSVSIEESISPFLPKTIVETVKPINENTYDTRNTYVQNPLRNDHRSNVDQRTNGQSSGSPNNFFPSAQPIYGQRTKLYKPSQNDYNGYRTFDTTPRATVDAYTTSRPDYTINPQVTAQNSYATVKPNIPSNSYSNGATQSPISRRPYHQAYSTQAPAPYVTSGPTFGSPTQTPRSSNQPYPTESPLATFANLPRYTIENGVRYENRIVWKYPDGKVSQSPPLSYVSAYNDFLAKQKTGPAPSITSNPNYQNSDYQIPAGFSNQQSLASGLKSFRDSNYGTSQFGHQLPGQKIRYTSFGNVNSKSPAQFPKNDDSEPIQPSHFVSSASLGSGNRMISGQRVNPSQSSESSFHGQYGLKTSARGSGSSASSGYSGTVNDDSGIPKDSYGSKVHADQLPLSKYAVNSPNPEYTYSTDSPLRSTSPSTSESLFTPAGDLSPRVLSKYTSEAQNYLTKVFDNGPTKLRDSTGITKEPASTYASANYNELLSYNPSIGQYIRDPASILNARPTFIQAGNSLIPVIILRVDGASPIRPRTTSSINLKSLLQQYLTRYADTIGQNPNYEIGNHVQASGVQSIPESSQNPLYELAQLAQSLTQYTRDPSIVDHYAKRLEGNLMKSTSENSYGESGGYGGIGEISKNDGTNNYYGGKIGKQKVKSVQIIEDPRFTSYKVNS